MSEDVIQVAKEFAKETTMFDFNQLLSFLRSPQVMSFIATYATTKGLDSLLKTVKSKDTIEYQLIICLEKALAETCNNFGWEYDSRAIPETFLLHWRSIKTIDTTQSLSSVIEKAVGHQVSSEELEYWAHSFYKAISNPECSHLYNYLALNKLTGNGLSAPENASDIPTI